MALSRVGLVGYDSVSNAQIKPNTIIPEDVEDRSITSVKLAIPQSFPYSANVTGNISVTRSLAVGYTDGRVPQANLDVKNNVYIGGATTIAGATTLRSTADVTGKLTSSSVTPAFYGANVTGNVSVTRNLAVGWTDGKIPPANLSVSGNTHLGGTTTLGTALGVASGGTGATSLTDGGVLLGSGTGAVTAMTVLGDSELIVGDGATDPVAESGDTLRISIGVGSTASGTVMQIYSANTTGNSRVARGLAIGYANSEVPGANLDVKGNTYISGATTLATSLGIGTSLTGHPNTQLEIVKSAQAHVRVAGVIGGTGQTTAGTNAYQNTNPEFDFADAQNWRVTLANNVTFGRPWNCNEGTTGSIFVLQDGTGSRTGSFSSDWLFAAGTAPTLTTTANANDRIDYIVQKVHHGGQEVGIQAVVTLDLK